MKPFDIFSRLNIFYHNGVAQSNLLASTVRHVRNAVVVTKELMDELLSAARQTFADKMHWEN